VVVLLRQRYAGAGPAHTHDHPHLPGEFHEHRHGRIHTHHDPTSSRVSLRQLITLGASGGIVPCPAALVVLLSAFSMRRTGFGLFLIVAFSVGLAAVLIAIGLLVVRARRLMARFRGGGGVVSPWLPLPSAAMVPLLGPATALPG